MWVGAARADEPAAEAPAAPAKLGGVFPGLDAVDQTADKVKDWAGQYGITVGAGFSASYQFGFNKPSSNKLSLRFLDKDHDKFSVDLAQLTLKRDATNPGDWGFMFQGVTGRYSRRYKSDWNGSGGFNDTSWERKEIELQQAYLAYNVPVGNGLQLKLGKFNTLVGAEVPEPWNNPTYSRSLLYNNAEPTTHVGGLASYAKVFEMPTKGAERPLFKLLPFSTPTSRLVVIEKPSHGFKIDTRSIRVRAA